MRFFTTVSRFLVAGSALTLLGLTSPSARANQTFTFNSIDQGLGVNISNDGGANFEGTTAGRYNGNLSSAGAVTIFCTDATHTIGFGGSFSTLVDLGAVSANPNVLNTTSGFYEDPPSSGSGAGLSSALEAGLTTVNGNSNTSRHDYLSVSDSQALGASGAQSRANGVAYLIDSYLNATAATFSGGASGQTDLATNLGGVQLAIWDILQTGGTSILTGNFRATGFGSLSDTDTSNLVNYYISQANAHSSYAGDAVWIQAQRAVSGSDITHDQDFAYTTKAPIPEPAFYQLSALLVLGGMGLRKFRKK